MTFNWRARQLMAARGMLQESDLLPLLAERGVRLSQVQVHRLVTGLPRRLNMEFLAALCDILECTPSELIEPVVLPEEHREDPADGQTGSVRIGDLRPVRARIATGHPDSTSHLVSQ
ncbi:helix-turn-helix transcriptional regulator [Streptomyces sp. GbtcB6]|uniref:helix-turn-helix domain-containing protein n=1 Tax=Streptomyces sp. GbtcB6 TaxID=2824751 RepID=UPI0020C6BF59|nr:helix-turn-helix transcriptional regulator [Streptomyces sp. GbtcB6]